MLNENNGASTDSLSDNGSGPSTGWLFYIGASGDIRYAVHNTSGVWQHGQSLAIANVSNQSSLTVVSYKLPSNDTTYVSAICHAPSESSRANEHSEAALLH